MEPMFSEHTAAVVVALLTFLTVVWNSFKQHKIEKSTNEINDAVNNRHLKSDSKGNVPPKLYDLVIDNHLKITELYKWKAETESILVKEKETEKDENG
jgi:hypothetical protein